MSTADTLQPPGLPPETVRGLSHSTVFLALWLLPPEAVPIGSPFPSGQIVDPATARRSALRGLYWAVQNERQHVRSRRLAEAMLVAAQGSRWMAPEAAGGPSLARLVALAFRPYAGPLHPSRIDITKRRPKGWGEAKPKPRRKRRR